jgi:hypothetical protein
MLVSMSLLQAHVLSFRLLSWHLDSGFMPTSSYAKPHNAQFIKISSTLLLVFVLEFQEILYCLKRNKVDPKRVEALVSVFQPFNFLDG